MPLKFRRERCIIIYKVYAEVFPHCKIYKKQRIKTVEKKKYYIENTLTDAIRELDAGYDHLEYHLIRHNTDEQEIVSICPKPRLQLDDKCIIVTANSLLYTAKAVMSALK